MISALFFLYAGTQIHLFHTYIYVYIYQITFDKLFAINPHHRNGWSGIKFPTFNQCLLVEIFVLRAKVCLPFPLFFILFHSNGISFRLEIRITRCYFCITNCLLSSTSRIHVDVDRISTPSMSFPKYSIQVAHRRLINWQKKVSTRCFVKLTASANFWFSIGSIFDFFLIQFFLCRISSRILMGISLGKKTHTSNWQCSWN